MRSSSSSSSFDLREAVENLRDAFTPRGSSRSAGASHGDLRAAILSALEHDAKNGHQVMQAIGAASGGMWMPSASQVYPMLQQLTDEGLLSVQHDGERSVYSLTDAGREAAAAHAHAHETAGESSSPRAKGGWTSLFATARFLRAPARPITHNRDRRLAPCGEGRSPRAAPEKKPHEAAPRRGCVRKRSDPQPG